MPEQKARTMTALPIGLRFGRLTVVGMAAPDHRNAHRAICDCSCGKSIVVRVYNLQTGNTRSCGQEACRIRLSNKDWPTARVEKLLALAALGLTYNEIAARMACTVHTALAKLDSMGVKATRKTLAKEAQKWAVMPAVRFEDHPNAESDRRRGRKPGRQYAGSLTGNAAWLCAQ